MCRRKERAFFCNCVRPCRSSSSSSAYDDCAAGVPRIRDLIASSEEELARRRRGEAPLPPPPQLKPPAERLADHLSREETLADFVADGED